MNQVSQIRSYNRSDVIVFRMTIGEFGGLSNMAPDFPVVVNNVRIPTIEALYQACRFPEHPEVQAIILDQPSPMTAKMKSKKYRKDTRPDWDERRVAVMKWCLRVKLAQNWQKFGGLLLKSGNRPIVEESRRDGFWGAKPTDEGTLVGMNVLGRLLMELRQQLISEKRELLGCVEPPKISTFNLLGRPISKIVSSEEMQPIEERQQAMFSHQSSRVDHL